MKIDVAVVALLILLAAWIFQRFIGRGQFTGVGWCLIAVIALALGFAKAAHARDEWGPYPARVVEIKDGDTFTALMQVFPGNSSVQGVFVMRDVRLTYIDAPETNGQCEREKRLAAEAEARLAELVEEAESRVAIVVETIDSFARPVTRVTAAGRDLGKTLLEEGLARRWEEGNYRDGYWCLEFKTEDNGGVN